MGGQRAQSRVPPAPPIPAQGLAPAGSWRAAHLHGLLQGLSASLTTPAQTQQRGGAPRASRARGAAASRPRVPAELPLGQRCPRSVLRGCACVVPPCSARSAPSGRFSRCSEKEGTTARHTAGAGSPGPRGRDLGRALPRRTTGEPAGPKPGLAVRPRGRPRAAGWRGEERHSRWQGQQAGQQHVKLVVGRG